MYLPGWRYVRNLLALIAAVAAFLWATFLASYNPLHWLWAAPVGLAAFYVWRAFSIAHPHRRRYWLPVSPSPAVRTYEKVLFPSRDGLMLFGWYLPGRNRAALILAHGLHGAGIDLMFHAAPLVHAGYGVLLMDLRAHGSSDGDTSTFGLREGDDIAGAVDYLLSRSDVDAEKSRIIERGEG